MADCRWLPRCCISIFTLYKHLPTALRCVDATACPGRLHMCGRLASQVFHMQADVSRIETSGRLQLRASLDESTGQGRHVKRSAAAAASRTTESTLSAGPNDCTSRMPLSLMASVTWTPLGRRRRPTTKKWPTRGELSCTNFVSTLHHTAPALTLITQCRQVCKCAMQSSAQVLHDVNTLNLQCGTARQTLGNRFSTITEWYGYSNLAD